jgi:hypothetical protein
MAIKHIHIAANATGLQWIFREVGVYSEAGPWTGFPRKFCNIDADFGDAGRNMKLVQAAVIWPPVSQKYSLKGNIEKSRMYTAT